MEAVNILGKALRRWQPWLMQVIREARKVGVAVPEGVEHVGHVGQFGPRVRALHDTPQNASNCLLFIKCSDTFYIVKATAGLAEVANC